MHLRCPALLWARSPLLEALTHLRCPALVRVQPLLEALTQPIYNLIELSKAKEVAITVPSQLIEVFGAEQQLRKGEELMDKFKHQVGGVVCVCVRVCVCHACKLVLVCTRVKCVGLRVWIACACVFLSRVEPWNVSKI